MICIKNGTLHTAVSKETFIADILIDGGKIVKIGKGLSADGAEVIDAPDSMFIRDLLRPTAISVLTATGSATRGMTTTN